MKNDFVSIGVDRILSLVVVVLQFRCLENILKRKNHPLNSLLVSDLSPFLAVALIGRLSPTHSHSSHTPKSEMWDFC